MVEIQFLHKGFLDISSDKYVMIWRKQLQPFLNVGRVEQSFLGTFESFKCQNFLISKKKKGIDSYFLINTLILSNLIGLRKEDKYDCRKEW